MIYDIIDNPQEFYVCPVEHRTEQDEYKVWIKI